MCCVCAPLSSTSAVRAHAGSRPLSSFRSIRPMIQTCLFPFLFSKVYSDCGRYYKLLSVFLKCSNNRVKVYSDSLAQSLFLIHVMLTEANDSVSDMVRFGMLVR